MFGVLLAAVAVFSAQADSPQPEYVYAAWFIAAPVCFAALGVASAHFFFMRFDVRAAEHRPQSAIKHKRRKR